MELFARVFAKFCVLISFEAEPLTAGCLLREHTQTQTLTEKLRLLLHACFADRFGSNGVFCHVSLQLFFWDYTVQFVAGNSALTTW